MLGANLGPHTQWPSTVCTSLYLDFNFSLGPAFHQQQKANVSQFKGGPCLGVCLHVASSPGARAWGRWHRWGPMPTFPGVCGHDCPAPCSVLLGPQKVSCPRGVQGQEAVSGQLPDPAGWGHVFCPTPGARPGLGHLAGCCLGDSSALRAWGPAGPALPGPSLRVRSMKGSLRRPLGPGDRSDGSRMPISPWKPSRSATGSRPVSLRVAHARRHERWVLGARARIPGEDAGREPATCRQANLAGCLLPFQRHRFPEVGFFT